MNYCAKRARVSSSKEELWFRYEQIIYKLCLRKCQDAEKARDFYQDIYVKFHLNAEKLSTHPAPLLWFCTVIKNHHFLHLRHRKREEKFFLQCAEKQKTYMANCFDVSELLLEMSFCEMSSLERLIIEYMYIGFSATEVSEILGISVTSVYRKFQAVVSRCKKDFEAV